MCHQYEFVEGFMNLTYSSLSISSEDKPSSDMCRYLESERKWRGLRKRSTSLNKHRHHHDRSGGRNDYQSNRVNMHLSPAKP